MEWLFGKTPWRKTAIKSWNSGEEQRLLGMIEPYKNNPSTIAIVGLSGQGKSSFVNTLYSTLKGILVYPAVTMPQADKSVTSQVNSYALKRKQDVWKIRILDCQGYGNKGDPDAFNIDVMENILKTGKWKDPMEETNCYEVNAVILCVQYHSRFRELRDPELTKEIIHLIARCNIPVFLMITHIDAAVDKGQFQIEKVFKEEVFEEAVKNASRVMQVDKNKVLLQCNYGSNHQVTDTKINVLTLYNLWYILETINC